MQANNCNYETWGGMGNFFVELFRRVRPYAVDSVFEMPSDCCAYDCIPKQLLCIQLYTKMIAVHTIVY